MADVFYFKGRGETRTRVSAAHEADWALVIFQAPPTHIQLAKLESLAKERGFARVRPGNAPNVYVLSRVQPDEVLDI